MEARVTSQSQSFRLVERLEQANIHHGQEIRADLPSVRVLALAGAAEGQVLFCNMGAIRVRDILNRGDDGPLSTAVTVAGLDVATSGTYDILNALVSSNGDLRLVVDAGTRVVPAANTLRPRLEDPDSDLWAPAYGVSLWSVRPARAGHTREGLRDTGRGAWRLV